MPLDPYQTLGVTKAATEEEIRKAYKKLARTYHPDANPSQDAAEKFQQVQQAYDILSDKAKRQNFDRFGDPAGPQFQPQPGPRPGAQPFPFPFDLEKLFNRGDPGPRRADRNPFAGSGFGVVDGHDLDIEVEIPFLVATEGGDYDLFLQRGGKDEHLTIKVPPGIETGKIIRLAGQGNPGSGGGKPGDLMVRVIVGEHPWFRRQGRDLIVDVPVTVSEAALGAKIDVPTLSEGKIVVTIPPGTSSGVKLRLKNKGVLFQATKQRGDLYAIIKIVLPSQFSPKAQELLKQLSEEAPLDPRGGLW